MSIPKTSAIDFTALTVAICDGISKGNAPLMALLSSESGKRHDLRDVVQTNVDKIWAMDGELKLIKGVQVALTGNGDGSTGLIPRMEADARRLGDDVTGLKSDMRSVKTSVEDMTIDLKAIRSAQGKNKAFMDGWKGVAVAVGILGTCIVIMGTLITGCVWLYSHGGH